MFGAAVDTDVRDAVSYNASSASGGTNIEYRLCPYEYKDFTPIPLGKGSLRLSSPAPEAGPRSRAGTTPNLFSVCFKPE